MYKTLLIDDEKLAVKRLARLLEKHRDVFEIIGEAYNGQQGAEMIEVLKPDLIFLDIEMPVFNGFEMLAQLSYMPLVVFATAFEAYAIRAFEENSIDYLLKPVEPERLEVTVSKLKKMNQHADKQSYNEQLLQLLAQLKPKKQLLSIPVKTGDRILIIRLEEIAYFEAEDKYVYLHTTANKKYLIDQSLTALEEKLPAAFLRISRSVILNRNHVREISKYFSGRYIFLLSDSAQSKLTSGLSYSDRIREIFLEGL